MRRAALVLLLACLAPAAHAQFLSPGERAARAPVRLFADRENQTRAHITSSTAQDTIYAPGNVTEGMLDIGNTVTLGGAVNFYAAVYDRRTLKWTSAQSLSTLPTFYAGSLLAPSATGSDTLSVYSSFYSGATLAPTVAGYTLSLVAPVYAGQYINSPAGAGTTTVTSFDSIQAMPVNAFQPNVFTLGASSTLTVPTARGLHIFNPTASIGGGATLNLTTLVGVDIESLTTAQGSGTPANISLRSIGASTEMRHTGPVTIGANAAPNAGAILDLGQNTAKTVILPKLTSATRDGLTAADGMVLYNSDLDEVQARASGAWEDLSIGDDRSHVFWAHALSDGSAALVNAGISGNGTFATCGSTAAACSGTPTTAVSGVGYMLALPTGTTSGNTCGIAGGNTGCAAAAQTRYAFHPVATFRIKTDAAAVTSTRIWCGLMDGDPSAADSPTTRNIAAVRFSTNASDTTFKGVTCNASACTVSGAVSGTVAAATEYTIRVDARSASQVKFTVNDTNLQTNSATLPASATNLSATCVITTLTTAARTLNWGLTHVRDQAF